MACSLLGSKPLHWPVLDVLPMRPWEHTLYEIWSQIGFFSLKNILWKCLPFCSGLNVLMSLLCIDVHISGLVQDCSNSITNALVSLQSLTLSHQYNYINGLVQERCNSIASVLEFRLSCTNTLIWSGWCRVRVFIPDSLHIGTVC